MKIEQQGEFGLIERIRSALPAAGGNVLVGIGDDVAVLEIEGGSSTQILATCDVQVEGVHFVRGRISPFQLGRKVAAINLSDIASMGGRPLHFLVSLLLPPDTVVADLEHLYDGLAEEASRYGAGIVGGNISRSPVLALDLTLLGEVESGRAWRRSGARAGDLVLVTGTPGMSAAGLALVLDPDLRAGAEDRKACLTAHLTPVPRLAEARALRAEGGVRAAIDISDGLAADLGHVCDASGVGVEIEAARVPLAPALRRVAEAAGKDPLGWALGGGEDYELLVTAPPDRVQALCDRVAAETGTPMTVIGRVLDASAGRWLVAADGTRRPLTPTGWTHF